MWYIKKQAADLFIASNIDSSGMSVFWTSIQHADEFSSKEEAEKFMARVQERYPREPITVEFVA